jgi:nitrogen fixation/metabolism regulation signal transduction histidine kinase
MKRVTGREMRKLILAITLMTLALVIGVIAYFMIDVILTANNNMEKNKQMVLDKTVMTIKDLGLHTSSISSNAKFLGMLNQDLLNQVLHGEALPLYELVVQLAAMSNPLEYVGVIADGEVVTYLTPTGKDIDPSEIPAMPAEGDYVVMDSLSGEEGYFVSVFYSIDLTDYGYGKFHVNMIVDRTQEMQEVEDYFVNQRNDLMLRMSIASLIAIILTLLITTFGLRYFTGKYVTEPIDKLNRTAEEIADGTFEGEVEVDPGSAYAALQGLLRSGQLILHKMDKEIEE